MICLSRSEVERLLDLDRLIDAVGEAFADLSSGAASVAPRVSVTADQAGGWLGCMASAMPNHAMLAVKLVSLFPNQPSSGLPTHQAVLLIFDDRNGAPVALLDATYITAVRTAAASAVATRMLARPDTRVLSIIGTGVQARSHIRLVSRCRQFQEILVAGRRSEAAEAVVSELQSEQSIPLRAVNIEEAVARADVLCATTHSAEPVVRGTELRPGVHVNSVGVNRSGREVDADAIARAVLVVDSRAACLGGADAAGANDITWAIREGIIDQHHIRAEIGELVLGRMAGRASPDDITLFKSVGVGVQDAAAAALVLKAAAQQHARSELDLSS